MHKDKPTINKLASISSKSNIILNIVLLGYVLICIIPLILVLSVSFTDEHSLVVNGYRFLPEKFSLEAYKFIFSTGSQVLLAYGITVLVTVMGTLISIIIMALYAFPISRKDFKYRNFFTFFLIFTMLFNGGLVSTYLIGVNVLHLKDNIWGLIVPYLMNAFWVIILRTFYRTNIPDSLMEAAKIDGAGEFTAFFRIILPLAVPAIATIALFAMLQYWNDWFLAALYINDPKLVPLPYLLYQVQTSMQYLLQNSSTIGGLSGDVLSKMPSEAARMAMVVIGVGPIVLTFPFFQKYLVKGLTVGSVKG